MSQSLYHPIKVGSHQLEGNVFLAPMAGYTDVAFRNVCLKRGASLAFAEMASCEALRRNASPEKTYALMRRAPHEKKLAIQLFAGNLEAVEEALPLALKVKPDIIDFNCGCPVQKVNKSGAGSYLMKNPKLIGAMIKSSKQAVKGLSIAITVKFRSGWDEASANYLETAAEALAAGADMLAMHPRTRSQAYSGQADWSALTALKRCFPQAVICGSGDLFTPQAVKAMLEETGIDAAMIARGALGNPFIFSQTRSLLLGEESVPVSLKEKVLEGLAHFKLACQQLGEHCALREMKKHLLAYCKGSAAIAHLREQCVKARNAQEILTVFEEYCS